MQCRAKAGQDRTGQKSAYLSVPVVMLLCCAYVVLVQEELFLLELDFVGDKK